MRQLILMLALLLMTPAFAAETPWEEVAPGVRLRLIASEARDAAGNSLIGLEVDMPADHKTYWKIPGETGIPTSIDLTGSDGVGAQETLWPYPTAEVVEGYLDYVYFGPTVLPVRVATEGGKAHVRAQVTMGICSDICVPAMASFALPLDFGSPDTAHGLRLAQAVALAPIPWDEPADPLGEVSFDAASETLEVTVLDPEIDAMSLVADAGLRGPLFGTPQKSRDAHLVHLPLLGGAEDGLAEGLAVTLTFQTPRGPYSLTRTVAAAGSTAGGQ